MLKGSGVGRARLKIRLKLLAAALGVLCLPHCAVEMKRLTVGGALAPPATECGKCHVETYKEWRQSAHARAWITPKFIELTNGHQVGSCLACHAPQTIFTRGKPLEVRAHLPEEGVTCITCHLAEGAQHGPFKAGALTPHAVSPPDAYYRDSALCGTCHQGTFSAWQKSRARDPRQRTCQECHMTAVHRKITQATDLLSKGIVALHEEHNLKRHSFDLSAMKGFAGAVSLAINRTSGGFDLMVCNRLPHPIPTGDFGFRQARLTVQALDGSGRVLREASRDWMVDLGTALEPGGTFHLKLETGKAAPASVHVRLERMDEQNRVRLVIADETLKPGADG